jgi:hypothetical protein
MKHFLFSLFIGLLSIAQLVSLILLLTLYMEQIKHATKANNISIIFS